MSDPRFAPDRCDPADSQDGGAALEVEPERYELAAGPAYRFELDRREFFRAFGAGILVLLAAPGVPVAEAFQESGGGRRGPRGDALPKELGAWIHLGEDGRIAVFTGKTEVGQNIRTSLSQVVADELRVSVDAIELVMADTDVTPFDMGTFGSRTTPTMAPQLRKVAAAAREVLRDRAASRWGMDSAARAELEVASGEVRDRRGSRRLTFAELTRGEKLVETVAADVAVMPPASWKVAGTSVPKVGGRAHVTGGHRYAADVRRPGQLHGRILRPPSYGARLESLDPAPAEAIPGVTLVRDGDFVGLAAPDSASASRALKALRARWQENPDAVTSATIYEHLRRTAGEGRGGGRKGSIDEGMAAADSRHESTYTVAYIAHIPLEPRAAVAEWKDGRLTVWTGTQRPFGVRGELAEAFRLTEDRIRVIVPDTGSGYGGKHTGEAAVEAARLARAAAKPVKLIWTREEEFTWAYVRPAGVIDVRSGATKEGAITAWEFHNYNSGASAIEGRYDFPNQRIEFHGARSPLKQGSYRGLAATANHFARESHLDEVAHKIGLDPLDLRLKNLKDARQRAVLQAAAERFGWRDRNRAAGRGSGIAGGFEKGSYVATAAEVSVGARGKVKVERVVAAFECGAVLNPDHLRNQVEGSIVMGLGGALFEAVEFGGGRISNASLTRYRVPRFSDTPPIEVVLLDRRDLPSAGAGETPIVGIAPAVANAIFAATGTRLRALPLAPNGLKAETA